MDNPERFLMTKSSFEDIFAEKISYEIQNKGNP